MKILSNIIWGIIVATVIGAAVVSPVRADSFVNGGFEDANFSGWTKGGGTWRQTPQQAGGTISYNYSGDPGKSAIITASGATTDSNTGGHLGMVYAGSRAVRVNNSDSNYHFSTLTQTVADWQQNDMYFTWAAVLQEPSNAHPEAAAPNFSIQFKDETTGTVIYQKAFDVYNGDSAGLDGGWRDGVTSGGNTWKYCQWQVAHIDTTYLKGHTLTLSLSAYDCAWGGHGGYAYLDCFQDSPPPDSPEFGDPWTPTILNLEPNYPTAVPEPSIAFMFGLGCVILLGLKWRMSRAAA